MRHQQLPSFFFFSETASCWELACIPKSTPIHHGRETMAGPGSCTSPGVPLGGTPKIGLEFCSSLSPMWTWIYCPSSAGTSLRVQESTESMRHVRGRNPHVTHLFILCLDALLSNSFLSLQASPISDEGRGTPHKPLN